MPLNPKRLRLWFATVIILIVAVVMGFFFYARYRVRHAIEQVKQLPQKYGIDIQQTAEGFSLSKSQAGHTLFTVRASKTIQYKTGGRAELQDVNIIVYGRDSNRFDQIYGSRFEYDPKTGLISALGEVRIELEGNTTTTPHPDQSPPEEMKNPIHIKTSGLIFNKDTGVARTDERIEFQTPQASGSAQGAVYNSEQNALILTSKILVHTTGRAAADVVASHGVITKDPLLADLDDVHGADGTGGDFSAHNVKIYFRDDTTIERAVATGGVRASRSTGVDLSGGLKSIRGGAPGSFHADQAELFVRPDNTLRTAVLSGNAVLDALVPAAANSTPADRRQPPAAGHGRSGSLQAAEPGQKNPGASAPARPIHAEANRILIDFGSHNRVAHVKAQDNVKLTQANAGLPHAGEANHPQPSVAPPRGVEEFGSSAAPQFGNSLQLTAAALDIDVKNGRTLERAWTTGPSQIVIGNSADGARPPSAGQSPRVARPPSAVQSARPGDNSTTLTAARFDFTFDSRNHLKSLHGAPDARIVSTTPGQPDRVTTSHELDAAFNSTGNGIASFAQQGDFRYAEATRRASAERALYNVADESFTLTGNPRFTDTGLAITADTLALNRRTGDVRADGNVKTTYTDLQPQPQGAMLASPNPIHVTAAHLTAHRSAAAPGRSGGLQAAEPGSPKNPGAPGSSARFSGNARLWQDANLVAAPTIDFDRDHRTMVAEGAGRDRVSTVFVQQDKTGKVTPISVAAAQLTYSDPDRRAHFTGGVTLKGQDLTLTGDRIDVILHPRSCGRGDPACATPGSGASPDAARPPSAGQGRSGGLQPAESAAQKKSGASAPAAPAQVQQIVASGHLVILESTRRATGSELVYTPADGKFVLSGGPPSIFDAERGSITGKSLTFFSRDDKVVVESAPSSRTVTETQVPDSKRK